MELETTNRLLELAKQTKFATTTETYVYPIKNNIPATFFNELNITLENTSDTFKVVEIQFDTEVIILQGYHNSDGENYDDVIGLKLNILSDSFLEWCVKNIEKQ